MNTGAFERLAVVMERIVAGDDAAIFTLYLEYGGHIAAQLRRHLTRMGVKHIEEAELESLVVEGCLAIAEVAGGWNPLAGALPWNWAARRIHPIATAWVGQYHERLDHIHEEYEAADFVVPHEAAMGHADHLDLLGDLAACHHGCALVLEALERVASARDRAIVLELRIQSDSGDMAPAVTIGDRHGLSPAAVRQVACRVRSRLRQLAADDDRFAPLADLALVA